MPNRSRFSQPKLWLLKLEIPLLCTSYPRGNALGMKSVNTGRDAHFH